MSAYKSPGVVSLLIEIFSEVPNLAGALCAGREALFDPPGEQEPSETVEYRHKAAVAVCGRCPVRQRCETWAARERGLSQSVTGGRRPALPVRGRPKFREAV